MLFTERVLQCTLKQAFLIHRRTQMDNLKISEKVVW